MMLPIGNPSLNSYEEWAFTDVLFQTHLDWLGIPNLFAMLADRTIRREFTHPGRIQNGHSRPVLFVLISLTDAFLTDYMNLVIRQNHVLVVFYQRVYQWPKLQAFRCFLGNL
jgi:hypothetical protein